MCGINGFIKLNNGIDCERYDTEWMKSLVHNMNERIIHRGPDSEGLYVDEYCSLGMRRLSIIDIDSGSQPIYTQDHSKVIVFNGEIYNYRELRENLISDGVLFNTKSDTEVVLKGLELYGKDYIKQLEGMFGFCYYDLTTQTWILARDRVGEKPLYYYEGSGFIIFGSELKSLLCTGLIPKEINREALTTYFQLAYIPAPMSIINGVKKMMPSTVLEIKTDGTMKQEQYWRLEIVNDEQYKDYDYCKTKLRTVLFNSVERRMIADVPLGAFLSGGFDSSIIVGIMSRLSSHPIDTFTIGFKEKSYDESALANLVAKRNHTNHHTIILDWGEAIKELDELLDNIDEPFGDPSLVATFVVSKMTKKYVTVALSGDAGDELFAGYNKYLLEYYEEKYRRIPKFLRQTVIEPTVVYLSKKSDLFRKAKKVIANVGISKVIQATRLMSRAFNRDEVEQLLMGLTVNELAFIRQQYEELIGADSQKRLQYVDFHTVLEGQMLPKVDRASMKASLETRVPMLDTKVINLAFSMPSDFKIRGTQRKIILKDTFRDLLPDELFKAPKHGFDVPVGVWLDGILKEELRKYSSRDYIDKQKLFNKSFIESAIEEKKILNIDWSTKIWSFFVFQRWYENYIMA